MILKDIDEIKKIALSARERAMQEHACKQVETIRAWDRWWKGIIVTIFLSIIGVGGFAWRMDDRAAAVEDGVDDVRDSMDKLGDRVDVVSSNQEEMRKKLDENVTSLQSEERRLKRLLIETLSEFDTPRRRRDNK